MRTLSYKVPLNWNYFLFGDNHIGGMLRHAKGFHKLVKMMQKPYEGVSYNRGACHGDVIEAIMVDDVRYSSYEQREGQILCQMEDAKKEYWPIRELLYVMISGNHDEHLHRFGPITAKICHDLGVPFGPRSAHITFLNKGEVQFKHFLTHGEGTINSTADSAERRETTKKLALKKKLMFEFDDCLLMSMGHTHKLLKLEPTENLRLKVSGRKIKSQYKRTYNMEDIHPDHRWYVNTGSFLKKYGDVVYEDEDVHWRDSKLGAGYAERKGYPPIELGFYICRIRSGALVGIDKITI